MSKGIFWTKSSVQRQLSKIIVSVFTLSTILMTIPADSKIPFGSPKVLSATTNVADQPNLGREGYWNFEEHDLGADWTAK